MTEQRSITSVSSFGYTEHGVQFRKNADQLQKELWIRELEVSQQHAARTRVHSTTTSAQFELEYADAF